MIPTLFLVLLILSGCSGAPPPAAPIDVPDAAIATTVILIGDAGEPDPDGEPVLEALTRVAAETPERTVVVFLGDNVYPAGIPDAASGAFPEMRRRLLDQARAVEAAGCRGIFIPGNHDWDRGGKEGWDAVLRQEDLVESAPGDLRHLPPGGCPGPSIVDFPGVRLVLIDTQWWLHPWEKPQGPVSGCPEDQPSEILDALRGAIAAAGERAVVVAGHHPVRSGGEHGGHFAWTDHLFPLRALSPYLWVPLPVVGSAYPIARRSGFYDQDVSAAAYAGLCAGLEEVFRDTAPLAYASGHDHNLQVIAGDGGPWYLVSGGGIHGHVTRAGSVEGTRFAARTAGFMRLDVLHDRRVRLSVYSVTGDGRALLVHTGWLAGDPAAG